jgi:hypothetical protein
MVYGLAGIAEAVKFIFSSKMFFCWFLQKPVLRIRIRIQIQRYPVWIRILLSSSKNNKKNLDSYCFVTSFAFLSLKKYVKVPSKSNKQKNFCKKISFLFAF